MKPTLAQAKYILNAVTLYEWDRGPLDQQKMTIHQQVVAGLNDYINRSNQPFPTYKESK
jgi:hypothetical protein